MGSIGEFGMDDNGNVKDPELFFDFMSNGCGRRWVSPYTYEALSLEFPPEQLFRAVGAIQERSEYKRTPSQHLFLNFQIYRGGTIKVFPSFHYSSVPIIIKTGKWTPYAIELRDCHDKVLHAQRILITDPHSDLDGASLHFFKPIPFDECTSQLVFTCGPEGGCEQKELFSIDVPNCPPQVEVTSPVKCDELCGKVKVSWKATHFGDKPLYYLIRYSNDGGQSWLNISPRLRETEHIVDLDLLPGGEKCYFQILATEGIRTGMAISCPFIVQPKPCKTVIIAPASGTKVAPGQTVTFLGESFSPSTGSAHPSEIQWYSNLDGLIGTGHEIYVRTLQTGLHTISLRVRDDCGESSASIQIEVKLPIPVKHTSLTHLDHTSRDHNSGKIPP
jgi:hypothetical protein